MAQVKETKQMNWAEEEEELQTEGNEQITILKNGIEERVKITTNSKGQKVKTTTKVRVKKLKLRMPKRVENRKDLRKFGQATSEDNNLCTIPSTEIILMEHPHDQLMDQEKKMGIENIKINDTNDEVAPNPFQMQQTGSAITFESSKAPANNMESNTLRVANLSKSVTEQDLDILFSRFGAVSRISLPKVERYDADENKMVKEPRGFAYIAFEKHFEAEAALNALNGHGYDHLILKLEWAKPPKESNAGSSRVSGNFMSGYGQQLAQDGNTENASYFSSRGGGLGSNYRY